MSIKGLTDRAAAFPSVGILRKGEKKAENGNKPGKDLTFFRFVTDDGLAEKMFAEAYPNEDALRNINVFLPHKTTDENMDSWIEKWLASSLIYRSDGETLVLWKTGKGVFSTEPKPDPKPEIGTDGKRADSSLQVGRLSVIVPELGRFATVTVLTTSKHDIINLTRQLRSYEALLGDLRGIPFVIRRRLTTISTPTPDGKRARRDKWLLSIETQAQWSIARLGMMEREALATGNMVIEGGPVDDYFLKELPEGISSPFEDEVIETQTQPIEDEPEAEVVQLANGNGHTDKPYRFPSTAAEKFYRQVQQATESFYKNPPEMIDVIGGWFNFASPALWDEKLGAAIDHARQKRQAEQPVEVESQEVTA